MKVIRSPCRCCRDRSDALSITLAKRRALEHAEESGIVADSGEVRIALLKRVHAGEITLLEAQAELKKIKRGAKRAGKVTRAQAYSRG
jgi:hypothetical protein